MSYCDAFRPCSRVSSGKKKTMKVSWSTAMEKFFYKRISNYIKTCSTIPNTGKFARVKGWAKKHKCSIACDHTTRRLVKTRSNKISWELAKFSKVLETYTKWSLTRQSTINYQACQKSAPYFTAITNTKKLSTLVKIHKSHSHKWAIATRFDLAQGSHQAKKKKTRRNSAFVTVWSMDLYQCRQFFRVCDCSKIWSWFLTSLIIYRWLPCERPLCVGPLNFWEFGKFSRNFILNKQIATMRALGGLAVKLGASLSHSQAAW